MSSRRRLYGLIVSVTASLLLLLSSLASRGEDGGSDSGPDAPTTESYRGATDEQQLDLLRIQIGVPRRPAAESPPPAPSVQSAPVAAPTRPEPRAVPAVETSAPARVVKPRAKLPVSRATATPKPRAPDTVPASVQDSPPSVIEAPKESPPPTAPAPRWSFDNSELGITETDLPPAGTVIDAKNEERWSHLLTPGLRWALTHGASMEIVDPKPVPLEAARASATEQYHGQVRLAADKRSLENYVAGIPFPVVADDDPDLATKLIWNHQSRIIWDDLELPKFGCTVGNLETSGVRVEREYRIGSFRRLFHVGRMVVDPKPVWPTEDGIRYREMVDAIEPFEFKGGVLSYNRYQDPGRDDDAWLYLPLSRRVRRLSTSQRSEGVFGIDIDLDSYYGFAGNPAWFDWKVLGKKTFLAPLHAKHEPPRRCNKPGDFMFCDAWEPREMYVLSARSLIPGYSFSRRIVYVDAQSNLIPYNEVYDLDGQLWRTLVLQWKAGLDRSMPYSKQALPNKDKSIYVGALLVFDMQASHSTYCSFPAEDMAGEESAYYWRGSEGSTTPSAFDVSTIVAGAR